MATVKDVYLRIKYPPPAFYDPEFWRMFNETCPDGFDAFSLIVYSRSDKGYTSDTYLKRIQQHADYRYVFAYHLFMNLGFEQDVDFWIGIYYKILDKYLNDTTQDSNI